MTATGTQNPSKLVARIVSFPDDAMNWGRIEVFREGEGKKTRPRV